MGTSQSSIHYNGACDRSCGGYPAAKLLDGISTDGKWQADDGRFGCAHTEGGSMPQWFSLELNGTLQVTIVRLVGRETYPNGQGKDVSITIGPSKSYDANEPRCRPVIPYVNASALTDYECTGDPIYGKYVKISSRRNYFTMCEAQVVTNGTVPPPPTGKWEGMYSECVPLVFCSHLELLQTYPNINQPLASISNLYSWEVGAHPMLTFI